MGARFLLFRAALLLGCLLPVAAGAGAPAAPQGAEGEAAPKERRGQQARPAPRSEEPSLDTLREQCYGGRQRQAPPVVLDQLIDQARRAALSHELDRAEESLRRLLQAGGDEMRFVPAYGMTLEERNASAHERWKAKRCHELLRRLGRSQAAQKPAKK